MKKVKNTASRRYVINDVNGAEIIETFYEKELQIVIKKKGDRLSIKWKGYEKDLIRSVLFYHIKMIQYFPKPYKHFGGDINVKVDLSNYATKIDIKNI